MLELVFGMERKNINDGLLEEGNEGIERDEGDESNDYWDKQAENDFWPEAEVGN